MGLLRAEQNVRNLQKQHDLSGILGLRLAEHKTSEILKHALSGIMGLLDPGSRIRDPGSWIQDPGSWIQNP